LHGHDLVLAGFSATFTVSLVWAAGVLFMAGLGAGSRRSTLEHAVSAGVVAGLFGLAMSQRGVSSADAMTRWTVVGLVVFAVDLGRRRQHSLHPSTVLWSLMLGSVAVLLRGDVFGPLLGVLRGGWQSSPDRSDLFLYHLGSGLGLALLYGGGAAISYRLPPRVGRSVAGVGAAIVVALYATGWFAGINEWLLLRWPVQRWG
jgi:hypothetical protein